MGCTVVVGLDGSGGSIRALHWAAAAAQRMDATLQPVFAWEYPALALLPFPAGLPVPPQEAMQADAEVRAQGLVESAGALDGLDTVAEPLVLQGTPGRVLCDAAASADLLVIGSRGLGSVKGVLLGSVSAHCANAAPCPVVIVPEDAPDEVGAEGGADGEGTGLVLVGVDGSASSDAAVKWADQWAPEGSVLLLMHVWNVPITTDASALTFDVEAMDDAAKRLLDAAADLVTDHEVETLRVRGDARMELQRRSEDADLVVIGARGHSMFERFLMGSVASHTVHHLSKPTVVVRAPSDRSPE